MTPDPIQAARDALNAGQTGTFPLGRNVLCDVCDTDLTDDPRTGGFMFGSYAYGPCCAERQLITIRRYGEEWNIRARCPEGVSFADWIRSLRGPDAGITVRAATSLHDLLGGES